MKRFFKTLLAVCMVAVFAACSTTAVNKQAAPTPKPDLENKCSVYVANETRDITIGIVCVVPKNNPKNCLYGDIILYPKAVAEKDGSKISDVTLYLEKGVYMFFLVSADKTTQQLEKHYLIIVVEKDGTLIFDDKETDV